MASKKIIQLTRNPILVYLCIPTFSCKLFPRENKTIILPIKTSIANLEITNKFGYTYHKTDKFEGDTLISSKFQLDGSYQNQLINIQEFTFAEFYDRSEKVFISYELNVKTTKNRNEYLNKMSFCHNMDMDQNNIISNLWHILPKETCQTLDDINNLIEQNKDLVKCAD